MYEDEMEATTSVLLTTVLDMTAETTSQATAEPTTTTSTTTTTTTTTTTGMCPPSWVLNPAINFCYLVVPASSGTVDDALCDAQLAGATLASIHSADENDFIVSYLAVATGDYAFMGGYSPTPETLGSWYWTDGTMYGYENWVMNYPVAGPYPCMVMSTNPGSVGEWFNAMCDAADYDLLCMIAAT